MGKSAAIRKSSNLFAKKAKNNSYRRFMPNVGIF